MGSCSLSYGIPPHDGAVWTVARALGLSTGQCHHTEVAVALAIAMLLAFQAPWLGGTAAITGFYLAGLLAMTPNPEISQQERIQI